MTAPNDSNITSDIAQRVRRNTGSAALAAVCLIYCGFFYLGEPAGSDLFAVSAFVFFHTLRIGGILMALVALASLTGHKAALLLDGVVSVGIGFLLALTGVGMLIDGGEALQSILNLMFGAMFISYGAKNGRDFFAYADPRDDT